ncbi:WD repeat-containing protein 76 [Anguilla rostrata]|uniref:WD repeat-containing protein 76 n=1 Tax=Anguilla rostrata TaxID=7938 RepID=UPI0030D5F2A6
MSTETDEAITVAVDNLSKYDCDRKNKPLQGLSPYELKRLENIRQNQAFLTAIELPQANAALKRKPSPGGIKREKAKVSKQEVLPLRKSLRLLKKDAEIRLLPEPQSSLQQVEVRERPEGPVSMAPVNMEEDSLLPASLLELWNERFTMVTKKKWNLKEYEASLKGMGLSEERVVKVVKERVYSAAFHPCARRLLLAAGDRSGRVGLWDVEGDWGDDGVLLFEPHTGPVCCMAFSNTQSSSLLTLSYDGSLRGTDVERAVFDELYRSDVGLSSFDFLSHDCSTLLVSDWDGDVAIVDRRTPGTSPESVSTLDPKILRCVHVHPVQKQYFVAAKNRDAHIYDVRSLRRKAGPPVSTLAGHTLSVSSAYFSPITGNRVLTTCMDDRIRVFDTSEFIPQIPLQSSVRHNMKTGRWLTKLRAVWDPKREDCFSVGSLERPRRVELFHEGGRLLRSFRDGEHLSTVCSVTAFHPSRSALAGGNSSGRLHLFAG